MGRKVAAMKDEDLLLVDYHRFIEAFWKNEEIGEKRVNFFITLVTAVLAGIVALLTKKGDPGGIPSDIADMIILGALSGIWIMGLATFLRIIQRNDVTDEYKNILNYIHRNLKERGIALSEYELPFAPKKTRTRKWLLQSGLAEMVAAMNSFLLACLVFSMFHKCYLWPWVLAAGAFILSYILQKLIIMQRGGEVPTKTFRANAGAMIVNKEGLVLALERVKEKDAWQMPQGGIKVGEDPLVAVKREIKEETGIKNNLEHLGNASRLLSYELPAMYRSMKTGWGQVQYWFAFRFHGDKDAITLGDKKEFKSFRWMTLRELISKTVAFRRPVYEDLIKEFSLFLSKPPDTE
jgi:putative (di)nucleoside polyphosphate hydrolase